MVCLVTPKHLLNLYRVRLVANMLKKLSCLLSIIVIWGSILVADPYIVVSLPVQLESVEKIASPHVRVESVLPVGVEPELYSITTKQLVSFKKASLYITYNVLPFEKKCIAFFKQNNIPIIDLSQFFKLTDGNPHIWLDSTLMRHQSTQFFNKLMSLDSKHFDDYRLNHNAYMHQLENLQLSLLKILKPYKGNTILSYHPFLYYFLAPYQIEEISIETHGQKPSLNSLKKLIRQAKHKNVKLITMQPQSLNSLIQNVADELDVPIIEIDPLPHPYTKGMIKIGNKLKNELKNVVTKK